MYHNDENRYHQMHLRQRLTRFVTLLGIVFAITVAVVVTQRLSDDALALLVGLLIAGVPLLVLVSLLLFLLLRQPPRRPIQPQQQVIPPIILQIPPTASATPPALPDYGTRWDLPEETKGQRQWDVIGEE